MELVFVGAAVGGVALAGVAVWAAVRDSRALPAKEEEPVTLEVLDDGPAVTFTSPRAVSPPPAPIVARPVAPRAPAAPPARASPRSHAERAPAMILTPGVSMSDAEFSRPRVAPAAARAPPPPMREPPPMRTWAQEVHETTPPAVPTEWARRQVGPVEAGRKAGACGGCGARLSVSDVRPLRIACPVCGRTKLVA